MYVEDDAFSPVYKLCTCIWDPRGPGIVHALCANITGLASSARHQCVAFNYYMYIASLHTYSYTYLTLLVCVYVCSVVRGWVNEGTDQTDGGPLDPPPSTTGERDSRPTNNRKHIDRDKTALKTKEAIDHSSEGFKKDHDEGLGRKGVGSPSHTGSTQVLKAILGKLMDSLARKRSATGRPDRVQVSFQPHMTTMYCS